MLDLHKLKLKYREMSSMYTEQLMKPVFHTNKRSYSHIVSIPESATPDKGTMKSPSVAGVFAKSTTNSNGPQGSPQSHNNEFPEETASKLEFDINDDEDNRQRNSNLSHKNETF